jgi:hypothetical protein
MVKLDQMTSLENNMGAKDIPVPKSPGDVSWKGLIQKTSPGKV